MSNVSWTSVTSWRINTVTKLKSTSGISISTRWGYIFVETDQLTLRCAMLSLGIANAPSIFSVVILPFSIASKLTVETWYDVWLPSNVPNRIDWDGSSSPSFLAMSSRIGYLSLPVSSRAYVDLCRFPARMTIGTKRNKVPMLSCCDVAMVELGPVIVTTTLFWARDLSSFCSAPCKRVWWLWWHPFILQTTFFVHPELACLSNKHFTHRPSCLTNLTRSLAEATANIGQYDRQWKFPLLQMKQGSVFVTVAAFWCLGSANVDRIDGWRCLESTVF